MNRRSGTSLIDFILSIAIISLLFGGVYLVYFSIVSAVANIGARNAAVVAMGQQIETIRNLSYDNVGTVGGIPPGVIVPNQTVVVGRYTFSLNTTVRNIDDPFDGTLGGTPNDTAPADYKLVSIQASCPLCPNFVPLNATTIVAPKSLESATQNGSIFITVLNANGAPVGGASVEVANNAIVPTIDLTDTTNASGVLELVGVPTSTQGYSIIATKAGYTVDRTYPPNAPANPNPIKPDATVAAQTVTGVTFIIDRVSTTTVITSDDRCRPVQNEPFSYQGTKLIGTGPDVLKVSATSTTNASGTAVLSNMEWDTYTFDVADPARDVEGTIPFNPLTVNPGVDGFINIILHPVADPSLLVSVVDAGTGAGIQGARVALTGPGVSLTQTTDHALYTETDWSANKFSAKDPDINADTVPGQLTLLANASGTYSSGTAFSLTSNTFDAGGFGSTYYTMSWNPTFQPVGTSLSFQVAANTDNLTWNYVGPDGTAGTFFTSTPTGLPGIFAGKRYVRYKAFLQTNDETVTPTLNDVTFDFTADCVPPYQTLFTSLPQQTYTVDVTAANYVEASSSVSVGAGAQSVKISMTHL